MLPKITVPTMTFKIPSTGKEMTIRQMVSREEKILLMAKESVQSNPDTNDVPMAIRQICINCCMSPDINIDTDLTTFDLLAYFIKIRSISVSNVVKLSYLDSEDQKPYDFEVNLDDVKVNLPKSQVGNSVRLTDTMSINLRYPPSYIFIDPDYISAKDATDYMIGAVIDNIIEKSGTTRFIDAPKEERTEFVDSMPIDARNKVIEYIASLPTLYYKIEYENSKGTKRSIELTTLSDFFTL